MTPKSRFDVFLFYAAITGLAFGGAFGALADASPDEAFGTGLLFGLVMGFVASEQLFGTTETYRFGARDQIVSELNIAFAQLGYAPTQQSEDFRLYSPTADSSYTFGPVKIAPASYLVISVQVDKQELTLVGPHKPVVDVLAKLSPPVPPADHKVEAL